MGGKGWRGRKVGRTVKRSAMQDSLPARPAPPALPARRTYFTCLLTSFVISNMLTVALPPNTALSASSDLIMRLFFWSCSLFFLMYAHSFLVSSVRGSGFEPTTSDSTLSGWTGFMNAALGFRLLAAFFAMSSPCKGSPEGAPARHIRCCILLNSFALGTRGNMHSPL